MSSLSAALVALQFAQLVYSQPLPSFPLNSQLPPVARIGQSFSYTFSPNTFDSSSSITYSLGAHPAWLSIDTHARRLYGVPKDGDINETETVGQNVELIATDETGSTTMTATLVVSRKNGPSIHTPFLDQIEAFGQVSAPSSVLSYPSTDFKYTFDHNTFGDSAGLNFYAVSNNNSPLPSWISFDASSLTFEGKTPTFKSPSQPPQTFDIKLVASDIVGFSAASLSFSIIVSNHKLTAANTVVKLNATQGSELIYEDFEDMMRLDNRPVPPGYLNMSIQGLPNWLSYDSKAGKVHGMPGKDDHSTNFTVSFSDNFSDNFNLLVQVNVAGGLFLSPLEDMKTMPGEEFYLDLAPYFEKPKDIEVSVTVDMDPSNDWLNAVDQKISGHVPDNANGSATISIVASSSVSGLRETQIFHIDFLTLVKEKASPTSTTSTSETATGIPREDANRAHLRSVRTRTILLATLVPVFIIAALISLLLFLLCRRKARPMRTSGKSRIGISRPRPCSLQSTWSTTSTRQIQNNASRATKQDIHLFKSAECQYMAVAPSSPGPASFETWRTTSNPPTPTGLSVYMGRPPTVGSMSTHSSIDDGESWYTVDGTATVVRTNPSISSRQSCMNAPEPMYHMFPMPCTPPSAGNRNFDASSMTQTPQTIPSIQLTPPGARTYDTQRSENTTNVSSNTAPSSPIMPSFQRNKGVFDEHPQQIPFQSTRLSDNKSLETGTTGDVAEPRQPDQVLLASPRLSSQSISGNCWDDSSELTYQTGSPVWLSDKWSHDDRQGTTSDDHKFDTNEDPFSLSRYVPQTGRETGERRSQVLMSGQQTRCGQKPMLAGPPESRASIISDDYYNDDISELLEETEEAIRMAWRREDSGMASESSHKIFL